MKKLIAEFTAIATLLFAPLSMALPVQASLAPAWDTSGNWVITFDYLGNPYAHDLTLSQDSLGSLTGSGGYPAGGSHVYTWVLTSGTVSGSAIDFTADYTASADAVSPPTTMHVTGTILADGTMQGTWHDNYQGGSRDGTWTSTSGTASLIAPVATTVVVTPTNTQGWSTADTRPGGAVNFIVDATTPAGLGSLELTTDSTTAAKAQYLHAASTPIADVVELGYSTKQVSASFVGGDPSYQLPVFLNGSSDFTTLVYEPYQNGTVVPGEWQTWDVDEGHFWSTRSVTCTNGSVVAGGGGAPFYTLAQIQAMCPSAIAIGFGVNIGSNNPSYVVDTDLVDYNGTSYDFEPFIVPADKDQCKDGGWQTLADANGHSFKNQGQCVASVVSKSANH